MGRSYGQLSLEERIELQVLRERVLSVRAMARTLKRAASTVSREVRRNGTKPAKPPVVLGALAQDDPPPKPGAYNAAAAHERASRLACKPRAKRKLNHGSSA